MRRTLLLVFLVLSLSASVLSFPAFGQAGIWGMRGISRAFLIHDLVLFAADGRGVTAYDISNANRISRIDVESGDDETYDVALLGLGGTDLVVATSTGVERFAVASDGSLTRTGSIALGKIEHVAANDRYAAAFADRTVTILERNDTGGLTVVRKIFYANDVTAIAFAGDYLYVSADREPVRVYLAPSSTSVHALSGVIADQFALSGKTLWAASTSDGLVAIDVTNPASPEVVSRTGSNELRLGGVAASGTRVYAFEAPNTIRIFDVSDPEHVALIGTMNEWVNVIAARGDRIFFAGPIVDDPGLAFDPGLIPRELGKPLRVADGTTRTIVAEYDDLAGPVSGVWTDGSIAYVIDPPYLRVLDVSNTSNPREVTHLTIPNLQDRIRVKNGLAVIYGRAYVNILDVSVPLRPKLISTWDAQGHPPSNAAILKNRILEANEHSGMHVVDFTNPSFPVQIGGRKWHYRDMAASDDAAYAAQHDILLIVEIANDTTVVDQSFVPIIYAQVDIAPPNSSQPEYLLARGEAGLTLYSLEDRFHPAELDSIAMSNLGLFATGDRTAYIAKDGRLNFIDLTQGLALQPTEMRVTSPMQMSVAGSKIVVADRYSVRVYGPNTEAPPAPPLRRRPARP
jgi:hypothetical protein